MIRPDRASACALAVFLMLGASCDTISPSEPESASVADAAAGFVAAWSEQDTRAMYELMSPQTRAPWTPFHLQRFMERAFEAGAITDVEVELAGQGTVTAQPSEGTASEVPVSVTYTSDAVSEPVVLEGALPFTYVDEEDRWYADWERSLLWPGVEGAKGFAIETKWPKRAAITDRTGEPLAVGAAASRRYPQGSTAGTTVGHLEPLGKEGAAERGGEPKDLVGASGLELAFEEQVAGEADTKLVVVDRRGRRLEVLGRAKGRRGRNVKTTLDIEIQRRAEGAYGGTTGGAVVMDPRTGDLLAVVSSSPFDPNNYVGVADIEPFNRALSGLYPPGSAMKVVTAGAALDAGVVTADSKLSGPAEYRGVRNFESGSYPTLDFATAVQKSVNTAFAQVALDLGSKRLTRYAEAFGFNQEPAMALGAATSSFPVPEDEGDLMWGSIGQAQVLATPLQMASVAATVANGGKRMEPRIDMRERPKGERAMSERAAETLTELMQRVVTGGTGTAANISGASVAGKTGTAEVDVGGERKNHAWFICFAPGDNPKVAVAVVSEYGGVGGQVAAPLARNILLSILPLVE